jgi:Serine dehydrogenase proteinase
MSAATMVACAANQIVMGKHSFLGPIDPQLILQTALGNRLVPVQNILEQFERALRDGADPVKLRVWAPMLTQYGPDLLVTCQNLASLSEELVSEWLKSYMFKGQADAEAKGKAIARWLSGHSTFKTHARPLSQDELRAQGLTGIRALGQNQAEQDLFLSIHHATAHTFTSTAGVKIIENNLGKADMRMLNVVQPISRKSPRSLESRRRR